MWRLLRQLLTASPDPIAAPDALAFWRELGGRRGEMPNSPFALAVTGGFFADRVGYAFLTGYEAALRALFELEDSAVASFCVTEAGGNRPRAIETVLEGSPPSYRLTGEKRWATLAPIGDVLFVVARADVRTDGRPRLVAARVPRTATGVTVRELPSPPFTPEVPHAVLTLSGVAVSSDAVLPGDAYTRYVKPFRTAEDVYVHASLIGYVIGVARRYAWPRSTLEALAAALAVLHQLASVDFSAPEAHIALAGALATDATLLETYEPLWAKVHDEERYRWHRDRQLFQVARSAREARRERAWQRLEEE